MDLRFKPQAFLQNSRSAEVIPQQIPTDALRVHLVDFHYYYLLGGVVLMQLWLPLPLAGQGRAQVRLFWKQGRPR